jgi:hypothetical protein
MTRDELFGLALRYAGSDPLGHQGLEACGIDHDDAAALAAHMGSLLEEASPPAALFLAGFHFGLWVASEVAE